MKKGKSPKSQIELSDKSFWHWLDMNNQATKKGIYKYIDMITSSLSDNSYIVHMVNELDYTNNSNIMEKLSSYIPRDYFLELHYCISIYATIFGKILPPLISYVDELGYIEWLLYTETEFPNYRDHLVHMFKVAFVCDRLLSFGDILSKVIECQFNSKHFKDWCEKLRIFPSLWEDEDKKRVLEIALFLAAIFHDFGYGYYFLNRYQEKLFKLYQWLLPGADHLDINFSGTQTLLKSLPFYFIQTHHSWLLQKEKELDKSKIKNSIIAGFFRDCLPFNHSIASMFFILDIFEKLYRERAFDEKLFIAFQLVAEACMIHDLTKKDKWAHLTIQKCGHFIDCESQKNIPLAVLLILADELSIWKRPRLNASPKNYGAVTYTLTKNPPNQIIIDTVNTDEEKQFFLITFKGNNDLKEDIKKLDCFKDKDNNLRILDYFIEFK